MATSRSVFLRGLTDGDNDDFDAALDEVDADPSVRLLESLRVAALASPRDGRAAVELHFDLLGEGDVLTQLMGLAKADGRDHGGSEGWVQVLGHVRAERQRLLQDASGKLSRLLQGSGANIRKMEAGARALLAANAVDVMFLHVLSEHIRAAGEAGQKVRVQVYTHLQTFIANEVRKGSDEARKDAAAAAAAAAASASASGEGGEVKGDDLDGEGGGAVPMSRHHAPGFLRQGRDGAVEVEVKVEDAAKVDGHQFADVFAAAAAAAAGGGGGGAVGGGKVRGGKKASKKKKNKGNAEKKAKKDSERTMRVALDALGEGVAADLNTQGWAICDHFLSPEQVR